MRLRTKSNVMTRVAAMTCLTVALVAAAPQLGATGSDTAPGRVAVDQSYPVPGSGTYTVRGHGYGHGRGMSQYGANGAALDGLKHERILRFYYPGTTLETARRKIKVLITGDTTSDLVVAARKGLVLRDVGGGSSYKLPRDVGASRWRVTVNGDNRNVVAYFANGAWRSWKPGGSAALDGVGEFRAGGPITLVTPGGEVPYRGSLRAVPPSSGSSDRATVNVIALDDYVMGVVPAEMPASWEPEAVQSQAVAARTYGAFHRSRAGDRYYDICDTTSCQVYRGVDGEHPLGNAAVRATSKEILTYKGSPAFTEFSASSGGWTADGDFDYLSARRDPYDDWSGNYVHDWSVKLSAGTIAKAYPSIGTLRRIEVSSRDGNGQWQGRVLAMSLVGSKGTVKLTGDDFRWKFGLRSTWFSF
jgi:stage II sporulation protein D